MKSSYDELRDVVDTSDGGPTTSRPPQQHKESSFKTIASSPGRLGHSWHLRSALRSDVSSLPGSRGISPHPDELSSSGRKSAMGSDMRTMIVDKEIIESHVRKLKVENSTLQTENKFLKEKFNRAQCRITNLEEQLLSSDGVAYTQNQLIDLNSFENNKDFKESTSKLSEEVQKLSFENAELMKRLSDDSCSATTGSIPTDQGGVIVGLRAELQALKRELAEVKRIAQHTEKSLQNETALRIEAAEEMRKLSNMKAMLQKSSGSASSLAEKQVMSLESRLKLTEDRLHQERSDRAGKLSQLEEKLVLENSKLQVAEKELKRQFQREQDKNMSTTQKYKECRTENDKLRVIIGDRMPSQNTWSTLKDSLDNQQEFRAALETSEERMDHYRLLYKDADREKNNLEIALTSQLQDLVQDKHYSQAKIHNLEDLNAALHAEKKTLLSEMSKESLSPPHIQSLDRIAAGLESPSAELIFLRAQNELLSRRVSVLQAEAKSMNQQLVAKESALSASLDELTKSRGHSVHSPTVNDVNGESASRFTPRKLELEDKLTEYEHKVLKLSLDYEEIEKDLKQYKQDISRQQQETDDMSLQLEQVQVQLRQKSRLVEQLGTTEASHQAEIASMRESLKVCNDQLAEFEHELKSNAVELKRAQSQIKNLTVKLDVNVKGNAASRGESSVAQSQSQTALLENQVYSLQQLTQSGKESIEDLITENSHLSSQLRESKQTLDAEQAKLCQSCIHESLVKQSFNLLQEKTALLEKENEKLEMTIKKLQKDSSNLVERLEHDGEYTSASYHRTANPESEAKKAVAELVVCRKLLDARRGEIEVYREQSDQHRKQMQRLTYKLQVFQELHMDTQKEFDRLNTYFTTELKNRANDSIFHMEHDRAKIMLEKTRLENATNAIPTFIQSQLDTVESQLRTTENSVQEKIDEITNLKSELQQQNEISSNLQTEKVEIETEFLRTQEELQNMLELNDTLEQRLRLEKTSLSREKSDRCQLDDDIGELTRQLEDLETKYDKLVTELATEKQLIETLKNSYDRHPFDDPPQQDRTRQQDDAQSRSGNRDKLEKDDEGVREDLIEADIQVDVTQKPHLNNESGGSGSGSGSGAARDSRLDSVLLEARSSEAKLQAVNSLVEKQLVEAKTEINQLSTSNSSLSREVDQLKRDSQRSDGNCTQLESDWNESKRNVMRLQAQHKNLQESYDKQKNHCATLEQELLAAKDNFSQENTQIHQQLHRDRNLFEVENQQLNGKLAKALEQKHVNRTGEQHTDPAASSHHSRKKGESQLQESSPGHAVSQLENKIRSFKDSIDELQMDNASLKGKLETTKQDLIGKNKRLSLELFQNGENYDEDRVKLVAQAEQLTRDLDTARHQLASKNRDNLRLKEENLTFEGQLREVQGSAMQARESLKVEEQTRETLDKRNMELELMHAKMRSKGSDNIGYESNKSEVQQMMNDYTKKMQDQMVLGQRNSEEQLSRERRRWEDVQKRMLEAESAYSKEQAMHIICRSQLQSVDDENYRLRTELTTVRRRLSSATYTDLDRTKSRTEEINEMIAQSQSRARMMLASTHFNSTDDSFRPNSSYMPSQNQTSAQSNMPNSQYWRMTSTPTRTTTDGNRSFGSDH